MKPSNTVNSMPTGSPVLFLLILLIAFNSYAQQPAVIYDEALVPAYTLPDPLLLPDGTPVADPQTWWNIRRPEILSLFEREVYGKTPSAIIRPVYKIPVKETDALNGKAVRKEIDIIFITEGRNYTLTLLLILPKKKTPVPVFLGLNFDGNHTITDDPGIAVSKNWEASSHPRGEDSLAWPVDLILERGYGLATMYYGDIDPDIADGFQDGVHPLFYEPGQTTPRPDEWGSIGAWAWGLSRALDYMETDSAVDPLKVMLIGHSRLGKTALWAGAQDQRFAGVISNNSGCGGAALSMRTFGETISAINTRFPHWFCTNFRKYNGNEAALPVDQHFLLALVAPRPVYIASAKDDLWADPKGEFLAALYADPVYRMLNTEGLPVREQPPVNQPVMGTIGYHIRAGGHALTRYDWEQYLDFADKHFHP
jgi:hypothetical protein